MISMRDITPADKEQMRVWRNMPEVAQWMFTNHQVTPEEHERWFARMMTDEAVKYWMIQLDGEGVGVASINGIDRVNSRCYWTFYLASPNVRGRGVGSYVEWFILNYVFDELKLNKLCGEVLDFNEVVLRMHEGFGFKREGVLKQHAWKDGALRDVVLIAIFGDEWRALRPAVEDRLVQKGVLQASERRS